ncbi:hypothetical protein DXV76_07550 [Rhodobacteraceae bacterium CCMM004]|nr:hypothetical protein DXV76_07550 [Rhodobacteraceae bacterium CCMM004]
MTGTTLFFVADGPHLEAQALLLAASLRRHLGAAPALIAYVPDRPDREMPAATRAALAHLNVAVEPLRVPRDLWQKPFPHGNKILAACAPRRASVHVFLDTDMVCVAPLDLDALSRPGALSAVPEGVPGWGKGNDRWDRVYGHFGLPLPEDRVRLTRRRRVSYLPYFNAGLLAWHDGFGAGGRPWPELWRDTAVEIDWNVRVAKKRPWLDQIALPVALRRHGLAYRVLPDRVNFSISDRAFEPAARPALIHYHSFRYTPEWPQVADETAAMAAALGPHLGAMEALYDGVWHGQEAGR